MAAVKRSFNSVENTTCKKFHNLDEIIHLTLNTSEKNPPPSSSNSKSSILASFETAV